MPLTHEPDLLVCGAHRVGSIDPTNRLIGILFVPLGTVDRVFVGYWWAIHYIRNYLDPDEIGRTVLLCVCRRAHLATVAYLQFFRRTIFLIGGSTLGVLLGDHFWIFLPLFRIGMLSGGLSKIRRGP